jgi:hypothetical protein
MNFAEMIVGAVISLGCSCYGSILILAEAVSLAEDPDSNFVDRSTLYVCAAGIVIGAGLIWSGL